MNNKFRSFTFTDISPYFLEKAKTKYEQVNKMVYKKLDIEVDPTTQGNILTNEIFIDQIQDLKVTNMTL